MSQYYIDTANGPRGPYPAEQIISGVQQGRIPTGATLRDAATGATMRAVDLTSQSSPAESGGYAPVQRPAGTSPQFRPTQPGVPAQQFQQPQYAPPQYQQPQYPPQQQYPQQQPPQYPGNYHQPQYAPQSGPYPQQGAYQPYGSAQAPVYYQTPQTSNFAIVSLVLSLVTLVTCLPTWIGGIIFGILALNECQPKGPKNGRGLALGGLWSGIGIGLLYLLFFVAVIAADA